MKKAGQLQGQAWGRHKSGDERARWLTISAVRDGRGEVTNHVAKFSDTSEHKAQAARIG